MWFIELGRKINRSNKKKGNLGIGLEQKLWEFLLMITRQLGMEWYIIIIVADGEFA